ncbi:hypothetical protein EDD22DRAFT_849477 [Suillus occidentalis]|nr:hypothetical protein EDD22DRAFT_849477 [Suillus occidentalis]
MARTKPSTGVQPQFNDRESAALQSHLKEWENGNRMDQRLIFKAAVREAKMLAPQMDKELLKQRKHKYRQWFHNHKKVHSDSKAPTKKQKKWTARREAEKKAERWTNQAPDAAVQAKTARKKGEKMIKSFAKEMYIEAGMRVFVLGSWKDEKGSLLTSGFDFNEQLGKGSNFMKGKDWQAILPAWEDFIGDVFDQDEDQDVTLLGGTQRVPKPYHEFDLDRSDFTLETKKAMIRSFLTIHYTACRKMLWKAERSLVPWSDIMKGQSRFISSTYLPDNTKILEPSKLLSKDANAILNFWWDRQETQVGPTFMFKGWIDDMGKMHSPVAEDESDHDADDENPRPRPTRKPTATRRITKRPRVSSTEEESEKTDVEVSPPTVTKRQQDHTHAEDSDRSSD